MKTKLLVGGLMVLMVGCSDRNRFEILQQSPDRITVLFDRNTGDILKIAWSSQHRESNRPTSFDGQDDVVWSLKRAQK